MTSVTTATTNHKKLTCASTGRNLLKLAHRVSLSRKHAKIHVGTILPKPVTASVVTHILTVPRRPMAVGVKVDPTGHPKRPVRMTRTVTFLTSSRTDFVRKTTLTMSNKCAVFWGWLVYVEGEDRLSSFFRCMKSSYESGSGCDALEGVVRIWHAIDA